MYISTKQKQSQKIYPGIASSSQLQMYLITEMTEYYQYLSAVQQLNIKSEFELLSSQVPILLTWFILNNPHLVKCLSIF